MHGAHFSAGSSMIQSRDTYNMCVWQLIVGWQEMHMARKKNLPFIPNSSVSEKMYVENYGTTRLTQVHLESNC